MSIKNLGAVSFIKSVELKKRSSTAESSADRDANGQQQNSHEEKSRDLTPEELKKIVEHLQSLAGVKDNSWQVKLEQKDRTYVIYIQDYAGKIIRRFNYEDIFQIFTKLESKKSDGNAKGGLLDRAG